MAEGDSYAHVKMDWDNHNKSQAMSLFQQQCQMIIRKLKITDKQDQVDEILLRTGNKGILKFNSWGLDTEDKKNPDKIWEKFLEYGTSDQNYRVARLALRNMRQKGDGEPESFDSFISRLRLQAVQCSFKAVKADNETNSELDERLIEQLIAGTIYNEVQKELLGKDSKLTLDKALKVAKHHEASDNHMKQLKLTQSDSPAAIAAIKRNNDRNVRSCQKCGGKHPPKPREKCPAYGTECHICHGKHHWASVCRAKKQTDKGDRNTSSRDAHKSQRQHSGYKKRRPP